MKKKNKYFTVRERKTRETRTAAIALPWADLALTVPSKSQESPLLSSGLKEKKKKRKKERKKEKERRKNKSLLSKGRKSGGGDGRTYASFSSSEELASLFPSATHF